MLKSLEMKKEIKALREEMQALIDQEKPVPVEMQNKLQDALSDYEKQLEAEAVAKNSKNKGENNMDKKSFNAALKSYLLGIKNEDTAKFFNTATGQNGAVDADGGVLIPSELLDLKENNGINNDLRSLTTAISVGTRSGSVPIIDYSHQHISTITSPTASLPTRKKRCGSSRTKTLRYSGSLWNSCRKSTKSPTCCRSMKK